MPEKGRLQDVPSHFTNAHLGVFVAENGATGVDFGGHFGVIFGKKCDKKALPTHHERGK